MYHTDSDPESMVCTGHTILDSGDVEAEFLNESTGEITYEIIRGLYLPRNYRPEVRLEPAFLTHDDIPW